MKGVKGVKGKKGKKGVKGVKGVKGEKGQESWGFGLSSAFRGSDVDKLSGLQGVLVAPSRLDGQASRTPGLFTDVTGCLEVSNEV